MLLAIHASALTPGPCVRAQSVPPPRRLDWVREPGAESCISAAGLVEELAALGVVVDPRNDVGGPTLEGWVQWDAERQHWRASVRVFDASGALTGERSVDSAGGDCAGLTPSILLVLSLLLEGAHVGSRTVETPLPAPAVSQSPTPAQPPEPSRSAEKALPQAPRWQTFVYATLGLASGVNPSLTYGPSAGVSVRSPWWLSLSVQGSYWARSERTLPSEGAAASQVTFRAAQADVALCAHTRRLGRLTVAGCWGAFVGAHLASSFGLDADARLRRAYGGPSVALNLEVAVAERWSVRVGAGAGAVGRQDTFTYADPEGNEQVAFAPPLFTFFPSVGLGARL